MYIKLIIFVIAQINKLFIKKILSNKKNFVYIRWTGI